MLAFSGKRFFFRRHEQFATRWTLGVSRPSSSRSGSGPRTAATRLSVPSGADRGH